jgi:hypothetical protein
MPLVAHHVRLTNSGKVPDYFLAAKIQQPTDLADAKLGKLFFVLQINCPWNHVAPIGTSIINTVTREYYRQEGHVPLENFEKAVAKANRLIEQLVREGETSCFDNMHAIIALAVGDEVHITYAGEAEAYFLRDDKLNAITDPDRQPSTHSQTFTSLVTGEVSPNDTLLMGTPGLYSAVTTDDLETILKLSPLDAAKAIARQAKTAKIRNANAIIVRIESLKHLEEQVIEKTIDTVYLDQAIDSAWQVASYNAKKLIKPLVDLASWSGKKIRPKLAATNKKVSNYASTQWKKTAGAKLPKMPELPKLPKVQLPHLSGLAIDTPDNVHVNHYGTDRKKRITLPKFIHTPVQLLQDLGKQFRKAIRRSPRTWYVVIALIILSSIGASIQTRKQQAALNPIVPTASLEEMKSLLEQAKQAKAFGDANKVRTLLTQAAAKGELAKQDPKLAAEASNLLGQTQRDLDVLAGATRLDDSSPLLTLNQDVQHGAIAEGVFYYTNEGSLYRSLLTGGEATLLGSLPNDQSVNEFYYDVAGGTIYLQSYTGSLFAYSIKSKKLSAASVTEGTFSPATGLNSYGDSLYMIDPATNQILKYTKDGDTYAKATNYLKSKKTDLTDTVALAIDGSVFALHKTGVVDKFVRGTSSDFTLTNVPVPFNEITDPLTFAAVEDGSSYYLADRGNDTIPPRIMEFDKSGKFVHQYMLPQKWQKDLKLIIGNPKSHKAWVVVGKELHEFTLVQ